MRIASNKRKYQRLGSLRTFEVFRLRDISAVEMRIILVFILFLLFGVTEGKTQRHNDAKTQSKDSATLCLCDSASYYESQIRMADSLYKNYLPQSNFEDVKAAVEFFDSLRLIKTTDNSQRTTDFFRRSKTKSCTSDACSRTVDCCPLSVDFICAKAHYYHAVGPSVYFGGPFNIKFTNTVYIKP